MGVCYTYIKPLGPNGLAHSVPSQVGSFLVGLLPRAPAVILFAPLGAVPFPEPIELDGVRGLRRVDEWRPWAVWMAC